MRFWAKRYQLFSHVYKRSGFLWLIIALALVLSACTRAAVPVAFETSVSDPQPNPTDFLEVTREFEDPVPNDFGVVWVDRGRTLPLRSSAGIAAESIAELAYDQADIVPTGMSTSLGSSTWLQVETSFGEIGWVPRWNLTEYVQSSLFCADSAVYELTEVLATSLAQSDAQMLQGLLSPKRGLIIRYDLTNPEVRIPSDRLDQIFIDRRSYQWGARFASQTNIEGSFRDVILPSLLAVIPEEPTIACNEIKVGQNAPDFEWPGEYVNLNYLSLYQPAGESGNPFDWRTWIAVIEYVDGQPYLALLIQIRPQV